jgi:outer membrane protein assembly factor BamB
MIAAALPWPHGSSATPMTPAGLGLHLASVPWPAFLFSPAHLDASPVRGPQSAAVRWRVQLEGDITPGPVVGANGVTYVATNAGKLHAIALANGAQLWTFDGGGDYGSDLSTSPAILDDGTILWPGPRHSLFAVDPGGHELWRLQLRDDLLSPLVDGSRGRLYVSDQSGLLRAYALQAAAPNTSGGRAPRLLWQLDLRGQALGSPALAPDGTVYETANNRVFAIAPSGHVRWRFATGGLIEVSPAVAQDGTIVVGSNDSLEYGISSSGHVRWSYSINEYTYSSPQTLPLVDVSPLAITWGASTCLMPEPAG